MRRRTQSDAAVAFAKRCARKAEARAFDHARRTIAGAVHDIGTGFTILRRQDSPLVRLVNANKIGPEELRAAEDITTAFHAIAGAMLIRSPGMERVDRSAGAREPAAVVDAVARYREWANLWSRRAKLGDPTLEIVVAAVIDERSFRLIETDLRIRNGTASKATAAGLRDYAARAGWASGRAASGWLVDAGSVFRLRAAA